jgi:diketogulonate reductase-like aldo/keto reductase
MPGLEGTSMPAVGLGTMHIRGLPCVAAVREALRLGCRLLDTAQMYGNEEQVGQGIRAAGVDRGELFVVSKVASHRP